MTIREKIVARANAILGMSRNQLGLNGSFAWCAATVSGVLEYCGVKGVSSYSCNEMYKLMTKSSAWDEPDSNPIASDVILFDWNDPSNPDPDQSYLPLDHVGIVVEFNPNTGIITYINGNGNSSVYVTKQTIHVNNRCVAHWMRYIEMVRKLLLHQHRSLLKRNIAQLHLSSYPRDVSLLQLKHYRIFSMI